MLVGTAGALVVSQTLMFTLTAEPAEFLVTWETSAPTELSILRPTSFTIVIEKLPGGPEFTGYLEFSVASYPTGADFSNVVFADDLGVPLTIDGETYTFPMEFLVGGASIRTHTFQLSVDVVGPYQFQIVLMNGL